MKRVEIEAYFYILCAATFWGLSGAVAKSLFNAGISPLRLVQIRMTLAALILFFTLLIFDRKRLIISPKDVLYFLIFGIIGMAGNQFSYYFTVSKIQVGPAVLIQYLCPVWITLYAYFFQREPLPTKIAAALLLAVLGCYMVAGAYRIDLLNLNRVGVMGGIASSFFAAFYVLYAEKGLKKYEGSTLLLYGLGAGGLFYCVLNSPMRIISAGYPFKTWMAFFYIATFATLVPFALYFKGIERIRVTRASIIANWEPVMAGLSAYFILGEVLEPLQVVGGFGVIAAVILLQRAKETAGPSSALEIRQQRKRGNVAPSEQRL
jgi:drug/metabolite transporter (DMT)-like permease